MRLLPALLLLGACRDRTPPAPPCQAVNDAIYTSCPIEPPMDCETASEDLIRCVDEVAKTERDCALTRQAIARCRVRHGS